MRERAEGKTQEQAAARAAMSVRIARRYARQAIDQGKSHVRLD
jgi:hypothetical protein